MRPVKTAIRNPAWLLWISLTLGLLLRLWLAFHDDGIYWPDEIYQSIEPAHRWVFGYGLVSWEFRDGARHWTFPGLIGLLLWTCRALGMVEPTSYLPVIRICFCLISIATAVGIYRLARAQGASESSAAIAAAAFALAAPCIYFSPRAMAETASALPLTWGLALAWAGSGRKVNGRLGAALVGLATLLRLQNGIFCVGLIIERLFSKKLRAAAEAATILLGFAFLYGLIDKLTWNGWFSSAFAYLRFNWVEGKSALWGTSGSSYYPATLFSSMPVLGLIALPLLALSARRAPRSLALSCAFVALHSLVPHKELRFILPAMPLAFASVGPGVDQLSLKLPRWVPTLATLLAASISAATYHSLTFGQLGQYQTERPFSSAYDDFGPLNRLLLAASRREDLCGLKEEVVHIAWTGGYSYLHRRVPYYAPWGPPRSSNKFNYVITPVPYTRGSQIVATDHSLALARLSEGRCEADSNFDWQLP